MPEKVKQSYLFIVYIAIMVVAVIVTLLTTK